MVGRVDARVISAGSRVAYREGKGKSKGKGTTPRSEPGRGAIIIIIIIIRCPRQAWIGLG